MQIACPACAAEIHVVERAGVATSFACPKCGQLVAVAGTASVRRQRGHTKSIIAAVVFLGISAVGVAAWWWWSWYERVAAESQRPAPQVASGQWKRPPNPPTQLAPAKQFRAHIQAHIQDASLRFKWLQDLDEAQRQAGQQHKDVLLLFVGSDHSEVSKRLAREVFSGGQVDAAVAEAFVPVYLDYPEVEGEWGAVQDERRNNRVRARYQVRGYPTVLFTDAGGLPYAVEGYREGGPSAFRARMDEYRKAREQRDRLMQRAAAARDLAQLEAARDVVAFLRGRHLLRYYRAWLNGWGPLVRRVDPDNERGLNEIFFEADFHCLSGDTPVTRERAEDVFDDRGVRRIGGRQATEVARRLAEWKKTHRFQDPNVAVRLHLLAARLAGEGTELDAASRLLRQSLAFKPTDPTLTDLLRPLRQTLRPASATGFVVADGGYVLTNHHVVDGEDRLFVRMSGQAAPLPAAVVATNEEQDLALLRMQLPLGSAAPPPLPLAPRRDVPRGELVAVLGFPLGDAIGSGLKLTTGVISATAEAANKGMLLLDVKVNPGNSGGPLCDERGNVLGVVTAKTTRGGSVDSYGLARPAWEAESFVKTHVPNYAGPPAREQRAGWAEIDRLISPSVLMILTSPEGAQRE